MHDDTLSRTTNVQDIYPERANENASSFNITELQRLNAGSWFLEVGLEHLYLQFHLSIKKQWNKNQGSPQLYEGE